MSRTIHKSYTRKLIKKFTAAFLFFCIICSAAQAQNSTETPPGQKTNGCGAQNGWSGYLVPNSLLLINCDFKESCDKHDLCYGRCLKGGDLFGKPECLNDSSDQQRQVRRQICDIALQTDIHAKNSKKPVCGVYASIYRWAVENFASKAFQGATEDSNLNANLRIFLDYLNKNPEVYSESEVAGLIEAFNKADYGNKTEYYLNFDKFTLELDFGIGKELSRQSIYSIKAKK
jgi:hypothetical protein